MRLRCATDAHSRHRDPVGQKLRVRRFGAMCVERTLAFNARNCNAEDIMRVGAGRSGRRKFANFDRFAVPFGMPEVVLHLLGQPAFGAAAERL